MTIKDYKHDFLVHCSIVNLQKIASHFFCIFACLQVYYEIKSTSGTTHATFHLYHEGGRFGSTHGEVDNIIQCFHEEIGQK